MVGNPVVKSLRKARGSSTTIALASLLVLSLSCFAPIARAEKLSPDLVPPDVILPTAIPTAAQPGANAAQYSQNAGQPVPGQVNMGSAATGFAQTGGFNPQPGQLNPFSMKPVDNLRKPPGSQFSTTSTPPAGSPYGQPPPAGTSLQALNAQNAQNAQTTPGAAKQDDPVAVIETGKGRIVCRLFKQYAPITCKSFAEMANSGFYNGLIFHRVEPGFVIQGGCPNGNGTGNYIPPGSDKPRYLPLEVSPYLRHNGPGVLAMARTPNGLDTASCQFYITLGAHPSLDQKYTVFGGVLQGLDVVRSIVIGDKIISVSVSQPSQ